MGSSLVFLLLLVLLVSDLKLHGQIQDHERLSLCFFYPFGVNFVWCEVGVQLHSTAYGYQLLKRLSFPYWAVLGLCSVGHRDWGFISVPLVSSSFLTPHPLDYSGLMFNVLVGIPMDKVEHP